MESNSVEPNLLDPGVNMIKGKNLIATEYLELKYKEDILGLQSIYNSSFHEV